MPQLFPGGCIDLGRSRHIGSSRAMRTTSSRLRRGARDRCRLAGNLFNTAFILDDRGELIHRYCEDPVRRRLRLHGHDARQHPHHNRGATAASTVVPGRGYVPGRPADRDLLDMNFPGAASLRWHCAAELLLHPTRRAAQHPAPRLRTAAVSGPETRCTCSRRVSAAKMGTGGELSLFSGGTSGRGTTDGSVQSASPTARAGAACRGDRPAALRAARRRSATAAAVGRAARLRACTPHG